MHEAVINLHMHTPYSDGAYTYQQIAAAAGQAGLDAVIVTDHNVLVSGPEGYYPVDGRGKQSSKMNPPEGQGVLVIIGEEIHDQNNQPEKNHLLVIGADRELATLAYDPQILVDAVKQSGGICFIAHPFEVAAPAVGQGEISWKAWEVQGFTGIELWNGFSEFKARLRSKLHAIFYAYFPAHIGRGPFPETLKRWDGLLAKGFPVVAVGGSDAHALPARLGPLRRRLFPYEFHFRCVNTHLLLSTPLLGNPAEDRRAILNALAQGRGFVGYDLPASTRGFRFAAQGDQGSAVMGESLSTGKGVTFQIRLPFATETVLLKDGQPVKTWRKRQTCTYITGEAGVYRVEVYLRYLGLRRGWIFSNPIYLK